MMFKCLFPLLTLAALSACSGDKDTSGDTAGSDGATDGSADGATDGAADGSADGAADGGDPTAGEALYTSGCSACHGADGSGLSGPSLMVEVPGRSASELQDIVMNGKGSMPPIYTDAAQAADVVAYVMATFG